ncbi:hypothetical protein MBM_00058 [Drepanopeziza brunnea f. sp. 'multigermtubi' MB_m1]|uniref:Uncharacterized protein n=1 Tax=Marssonina brunnea f. sp. multigermtubi (strain MB_m1) TaxID=1072389 RepID=K1WTF4_MARBU|nr:uncharacterized protein MBM_00058 [Drepanopeziza brunnea f. sp. 'multigermtubi' MB_m1]EKD20945.1 hypothetical protein MBM_00058 [Drepanopeziza brunnea f. sp. 'multigermtubi' MB_m1]
MLDAELVDKTFATLLFVIEADCINDYEILIATKYLVDWLVATGAKRVDLDYSLVEKLGVEVEKLGVEVEVEKLGVEVEVGC